MNKELKFGPDARGLIKEGADAVFNAVKVTLGAKGRNVAIFNNQRDHQITKDGVTVAESIDFKDQYKDLGAQIIKEAASKTCSEAGDGTTTSIVLAHSIITLGLRQVANGANPVLLKRGIDKAVEAVVKELKKMAIPVGDKAKYLDDIAKVSSNNDPEIGKLICKAVRAVGPDGIINAMGVYGGENSVEEIDGFSIDFGAANINFINDKSKMKTEFENPVILIYDHKLEQATQILPAIELVASFEEPRPLVVIAEDSAAEAVGALALNNLRGSVPCALVRVPFTGAMKTEILNDIAILTGGTVVSDDNAINIEDIKNNEGCLGRANKIIIEREKTTIIGGLGAQENIDERMAELKVRSKKNTIATTELNILKMRIGRLSGKAAMVNIGASSETEIKEKLDRVEDAIWATRSAIKEGIVPGGGTALILAQKALSNLKGNSDDENAGIAIIRECTEAPLSQIAMNAGEKEGVIIERVKSSRGGKGWNALTGKTEDLVKSGIIDPVKVTRVALENAASVGGMLITTECAIVDDLK